MFLGGSGVGCVTLRFTHRHGGGGEEDKVSASIQIPPRPNQLRASHNPRYRKTSCCISAVSCAQERPISEIYTQVMALCRTPLARTRRKEKDQSCLLCRPFEQVAYAHARSSVDANGTPCLKPARHYVQRPEQRRCYNPSVCSLALSSLTQVVLAPRVALSGCAAEPLSGRSVCTTKRR